MARKTRKSRGKIDKKELYDHIKNGGYPTEKLKTEDIRNEWLDFVASLLNEIQTLKTDQVVSSVSQEIVKPQLVGTEKTIYDLLTQPSRFVDLVNIVGWKKQQVGEVLQNLISKGIVKKTRYSHKNVVYERCV